MDTPDTLTLARVDRENQGPWEAEYSYGEEADLHLHCNNCKKNPGHKNFIPVDKFSKEDLPEDYRSQDMMDYVRAMSDLTARVTVKYISDRRPATVPVSDRPYPGYSARGTRRMTVGTGCVNDVNTYNDREEKTCACKDCRNSSTPEKHFATISIQTATHVVFDQDEAAHTTFHLFFDRDSRPETCQDVVTLTGGLNEFNDINGDNCHIKCFTHDLALAYRLKKTLDEMKHLHRKISNTQYSLGKSKPTLHAGEKQPLMFIVSHPHGCSKQISVGHFISAHTYNNKVVSYQYSTPTCPGSSGASVYFPDMFLEPTFQIVLFDVQESHGGASEDYPGINFCPANAGSMDPQLESLNLLKLGEGLWEDYFSCAEEKDLHKHYDTCHKNPGHQNFFPVDKFSMDDLPQVYRTNDMFDLIKTVSDLTVRVSVKYVSEERPETVPGTDIPYPWYSHMGSNKLREGSGWINEVVIYENSRYKSESKLSETCICKECRSSLSPKTRFAHITIKSAAHLVYDKLEAEHTTCQLVVDSRIVTLTDICKSNYSIDEDTCQLTYVSHDMDLAYSLKNLTIGSSMEEYDTFKSTEDGMQNVRKNMKKQPPLYVVVSHPYGCAKQISISYCSNHDTTETEDSQSRYASIICPGSSGAPMAILGWETLYPEIMQPSIEFLKNQC